MSKKPRDNRPYLPPVRKIELSEGNIKQRWILVVVLLAIAAVSIGYGLHAMMNTQPGWQEVSAISDQPNCSSEFRLMYDFSDYGGNASAQNKRLIDIYSRFCEEAFRIFSPDVEGEDNLFRLNTMPNQPVTVAPALYQALELLNRYDNRCIFLAPVYTEYNRVFLCETDGEAAIYDPEKDPETAAYVDAVMAFVSDPRHIRLELAGEDQVVLHISEDYLSFAEEYGIESFLDFGWMKNAFIADHLAEALEAEGFTRGYLSSYDGYTRNLDDQGQSFAIQIYDRQEDTLYVPAELTYQGRHSLVFLRDFPMDELDRWRYYVYEDGQITSVLLDPTTGKSAAAVSSLVSLSEDRSCAQLLMEMIPAFLAGEDSQPFAELLPQGIGSVWCHGGVVYYNSAAAEPKLMDTGAATGYRIQFAG